MTNALGVKYGKRPVFLASNIITLLASIGSQFSTTWNSLLAFQLIGSIGRAPYETLVAAIVADLYRIRHPVIFNDRFFVHQRGLRLALWILAIAVSSSISGVVGGLIIDSLGWPMTFKTCRAPQNAHY